MKPGTVTRPTLEPRQALKLAMRSSARCMNNNNDDLLLRDQSGLESPRQNRGQLRCDRRPRLEKTQQSHRQYL